jgi:hypothetical protein
VQSAPGARLEQESGSAKYNGLYRSRYRAYDVDNEFEAGEVFDRSQLLTEWRRADGEPQSSCASTQSAVTTLVTSALAADPEVMHTVTGRANSEA